MAITPTIIDGNAKYLQVEHKEDSPQKLLAVSGKPTKYRVSAEEFELVRNFINLLRDDLDNATSRPEKRILLSSIVSAGVYVAQPGDEKRFIVIENDIAAGTTQIFTINEAFPVNSTFMIYLADRGTPFTINYQVAGGIVEGLNSHYSDYKDVAVIRKVTIAPNVKWLATYQIGSR